MNIFYRRLLVWASILIGTSVMAQTGTPQYAFYPSTTPTTGNSVPLAYQPDMRNQQLFPGGIFPTAPSGMAITAIYYQVYGGITPPSSETFSNYRLLAGNAPGVNALSNAAFSSTAGLTEAINQPTYTYQNLTGNATGGNISTNIWLKIPFATPVPYDPTQPLLLDISWTSRGSINWYVWCSGTAQAGHYNSYVTPSSGTTPTGLQTYCYVFGVDLAPLTGGLPKIPPLANFKPMNDVDTLWTGSPSVIVNTSSYSDTNYWAITGYSATSANGPWSSYSNPNDIIQTNTRGAWIDTVGNKSNFYYAFPQAGYYRIKLWTGNKYGNSFVEKSVYVSNPLRKPKAIFMSTKQNMAVYDRSQFLDMSLNGPTKWKYWLDPPCYTCGLYKNEFFYQGGKNDSVPAPYLAAADPGLYKVCLAVSNAVGSDTLCQAAYIRVIPGFQMCNGADTVGTTSEGAVMPTLTNSTSVQYVANGCNQGFRIAPCGDTIILTLERLRLRNNGGSLSPGDSLYIKTGILPGSPILRRWGGNDITKIKDSLRTVKFYGQQVFVIYQPVAPTGPTTLVNDSGFLVRWKSTVATYPKPQASFTCPDTIYSGYKVTFQNTTTGKYPNYAWDINNDYVYGRDDVKKGIDSIVPSPTMTYNVTVNTLKTICLRSFNCVGSDTFCKTIVVLPTSLQPFADFSTNKTYGLTSDTFMLFDQSFNGANQWKWTFEPNNMTYLGGTDSTSQNPIVFLNTNAAYNVTLTATNAFGTHSRKKNAFITTISYPSPGSQFPPTSSIEDFGIKRVRLVGSVGRIDTITPLKPTSGAAYLPLYNLSKTTLYRGGKYVVDVYRGDNPQDSMNLRVWIDFNRSANYLDDPAETLISEDRQLKVKYTDTFVVPSYASIGVTRMLVGAAAGFSQITPYSATLGVYEEFGINIGKDIIKPVVSLIGNAVAKTELYKPYNDSGATATDNIEGDISYRLLKISDVDIMHVGYYTVKYLVADNYGNYSDTVSRIVQVELNQTGPKIELQGPDTVYIEVRKDKFVDYPAIAKDNQGNDITSSMMVIRNVDTATVGTYYVTYEVSDAFAIKASKYRVYIVRDTEKPTIHTRTANDTSIVTHQIKTPFDENVYLRVDDNYYQNVVPTRTKGTIDPDHQGLYYLTFVATDPSGNISDERVVGIKVTNTIKPTINLIGSSDVVIKVFEKYNDPKAVAFDYYNNPIQVEIDPNDNLNVTYINNHTRTYIATDEYGNKAFAQRIIHVKDLDAPIITVLGENPMVIMNGTMTPEQIYEVAGTGPTSIKVIDNYDVVLTVVSNIKTLPLTVPGTYQVTYDAKDLSNNNAQQKQRFIQIVPATGLSQIEATHAVHVFPNPSKGIFTVDLKGISEVRNISIYNIAGMLTKQITPGQHALTATIDLSNEAEGMYMVRIETATSTLTQKVSINR